MNALCCFGVCFVIAVLELSAGFGDLRPPENVRIDSLNTRYVLRWDWPHETAANQTVTFTAQYIAPFLKKYQTDEPVMPFLSNDLAELIKSLLRRFVRRDILQDITTLQLTKLDAADKNNWLQPKDIDIGLGAESVLKSRTIVELRVLEFKRDCTQGLSNIVRKIQEKSPLKYATVRQMGCLNPSVMFRDPDKCKRQMKCLVQTFLQDKQLKGGVSAAAVGPPSSVKLNPVEGDLEIIIRNPLSSNNESVKILLDDKLSYLIQYWRRSEDPQMAKSQKAKDSVVTLTELDRQTWYCVRAQSWYFDTYKKCNKSSVFSDTHCIRTKGRMPYWQIALYILIILLLLFLPPLLYFRFYKMFRSTFWPAIQLPDHIQELWLSDSEKPQLLAPESRESVCEPLVMVRAVLDAEEVDEQSSNAEDQDSSTHGQHGSGDSGVYSAEEDSGRRSTSHADLQMSVTKHRGELHDGTLQQLCA
ncbi:interferon alpha beta receptor 1a-like protein [Labeo rohita]|uniref:Interferon alpha beta receptor 1a-like protein n=1 Tax=Labeo rohita TaxID=84645 RepID=A0A498LBH4_LABRO|nr:interferon alpha beta receptor 1a-like protein [Labeo rohita]